MRILPTGKDDNFGSYDIFWPLLIMIRNTIEYYIILSTLTYNFIFKQ